MHKWTDQCIIDSCHDSIRFDNVNDNNILSHKELFYNTFVHTTRLHVEGTDVLSCTNVSIHEKILFSLQDILFVKK